MLTNSGDLQVVLCCSMCFQDALLMSPKYVELSKGSRSRLSGKTCGLTQPHLGLKARIKWRYGPDMDVGCQHHRQLQLS